ncbi:MAG TPA: VWA domain-containing protein [Candidatus Angelobacter sp.]|jgi:VWFA-related protein
MRWTTLLRALTFSLLALFFLSIYSQTNSSNQPQDVLHSDQTLRTNTRLVVVDVVATDSKGQPVTDLKAAGFTVLEDGKPQKISGFNFEHPGTSAQIVQVNLPPSVVTNAPKFQSNSLNVILFDTVNGDFAEHAYAREQLLKFLSSAELRRPVAIFALQTQLKLLHDFTTENKSLSAVVAKYRPPAQTINSESFESRASAFATLGDYHTSERGIETTLNQLNALAKILAGYPGRKNLIWLSESFPFMLFPESMGQANGDGQAMRTGIDPGSSASNLQNVASFKTYAAQIKKVSDSLMAAQVAVYPVDAGAVGKDDHLASQHTMDSIAENTGGKSFKNSNDLVLGLRTSIEDGSAYYTLTYYPENKNWDGQFRRIQVKSDRANTSLRYREGYYAVDPAKVNKEDSDAVAENFSRMLEPDAPAAMQVVFQAQVQPPSEKNKKVLVTFHIDPRTLAFEKKDGGVEFAKLSCTVWAYGKDKDKPTMSSGTVNANLNAKDYQQMMQQRFLPCDRQLDLKPGTYTLRMGVLDRATNKIGTASAQMVVP